MSFSLVACPGCGCHAKNTEIDCPHCGERLRRKDGTFPRTAAAVLMGLTVTVPLATHSAGCSDSSSAAASAYGAATTEGGAEGTGGAGGAGGMGGRSATGGGAAPGYGVAMTGGNDPGDAGSD